MTVPDLRYLDKSSLELSQLVESTRVTFLIHIATSVTLDKSIWYQSCRNIVSASLGRQEVELRSGISRVQDIHANPQTTDVLFGPGTERMHRWS